MPSSKPEYNFAATELWTSRVDTMDDLINTTEQILTRTILTVGGLTVQKFLWLLDDSLHHSTKYNDWILELVSYNADVAELNAILYDRLYHQTQTLQNSWFQDRMNVDLYIEYSLIFWLLKMMATRQLLVSQADIEAMDRPVEPQKRFELRQLMSMYCLHLTIYFSLWGDGKQLIGRMLDDHNDSDGQAPLYLIRDFYKLTGQDTELLQMAAIQRTWAPSFYNRDDQRVVLRQQQAMALLVMDKLAIKSIAPAASLFDGPIRPITYFNDRTNSRRLPVSEQFVLVGLRFDPLPMKVTDGDKAGNEGKVVPAFELMAIPHEIGHFVYHHGTFPDGSTMAGFVKTLQGNRYYHWCEELFADTYGCMVAGPLTAMGLQSMLSGMDKQTLLDDDGEHPLPIIRPYILSEMLRLWSGHNDMPHDFAAVADNLDANWTAILQQYGFEIVTYEANRAKRIYVPSGHWEQIINLQIILDEIRPIIAAFVHKLKPVIECGEAPNYQADELSTCIPWTDAGDGTLIYFVRDMYELTGASVAFAQAPDDRIIGSAPTFQFDGRLSAEEQLRAYNAEWGDGGAIGGGGGTKPGSKSPPSN